MGAYFSAAVFAIAGSFAGMVIAKATVVCVIATLLAHVLRGSRASIRHLTFTAVFAVLLILPVAGALLPLVTVNLPVAPVAVAQVISDPASPATPADTSSPVMPEQPRRAATAASASRNPLIGLWIIGLVITLLPVIVGLWQARRVRNTGVPWRDGETLAQRLAASAGIRTRVGVLRHDAISGPVTFGVVAPTILLPADAHEWNEEALTRALVHELEHVRRRDFVVHCLSRTVCAVYWFHPLVWTTWRRLRLEAERACDDAVIVDHDPREYAALLVNVARRQVPRTVGGPVLAMAARGDLSARVASVLNPQGARGRAGRRAVHLAGALAALVVAALAPLALVAAQAGDPYASTTLPRFDVASIKPTKNCDPLSGTVTPGRLHGCGQLPYMIQTAYELYAKGRGFNPTVILPVWTANIDGAPSWLNSEMYDVDAKAEGSTPYMVMAGPMMQALLEDRFKLKIHRETREVPVYELTLAKGGPKLPRVNGDSCAPLDLTKPPAQPAATGQVPPKVCGGFTIGKGTLDFTEMTISDFSQYLGRNIVVRPIIDKTGLTGRFNFHLEFAFDESTPMLRRYRSDEVTGPSIFAAIEQQLGLKLEKATGPHEFLVIDSIERPSEN